MSWLAVAGVLVSEAYTTWRTMRPEMEQWMMQLPKLLWELGTQRSVPRRRVCLSFIGPTQCSIETTLAVLHTLQVIAQRALVAPSDQVMFVDKLQPLFRFFFYGHVKGRHVFGPFVAVRTMLVLPSTLR